MFQGLEKVDLVLDRFVLLLGFLPVVNVELDLLNSDEVAIAGQTAIDLGR